MDSTNFCYWLQGYFEIARPVIIPMEKLEEIRNHLELVLTEESENKSDAKKAYLSLAEQFVLWLDELIQSNDISIINGLNEEQTINISNALEMVFVKKTPVQMFPNIPFSSFNSCLIPREDITTSDLITITGIGNTSFRPKLTQLYDITPAKSC